MSYESGAQDSPVDVNDRLVRVGSKYQASAPAVADGDNVYFLVDAAGRLLIAGSVAHDAVDAGNPLKIGGVGNPSAPTNVATGDRVDASFTVDGMMKVALGGHASATEGLTPAPAFVRTPGSNSNRPLGVAGYVQGPDTGHDQLRGAGNSAPGLGALNVALIGGDQALRASAAESGNGTSTALDNMGWVKSFVARLDVTAVPSGGTPTLNVYIQTQLPSGDWQDIAHFTEVAGSTTSQICDWGRGDGNISGIGAEGSAMTFDRFFAAQDAALTAANIRVMTLGDSLRVKWVKVVGGSSGNYTFAVDSTFHA